MPRNSAVGSPTIRAPYNSVDSVDCNEKNTVQRPAVHKKALGANDLYYMMLTCNKLKKMYKKRIFKNLLLYLNIINFKILNNIQSHRYV